MEIAINNRDGSMINFDILGLGNVLLDLEKGYFDCKSYDDSDRTDDEFHDYVLININEIVGFLNKPTYGQIVHDLKNLQHLSKEELIDMSESVENLDIFKVWCEESLVLLIEEEDYENCTVVKKILSYL